MVTLYIALYSYVMLYTPSCFLLFPFRFEMTRSPDLVIDYYILINK